VLFFFFYYRIPWTGACFYSGLNNASSPHKVLCTTWCKFANTQLCSLLDHYFYTSVILTL